MSDEILPETIENISRILAQGNKIEAIKLYRTATGKGLKESKDFIDALIPKLLEQDPVKYAKLEALPGGCAGMLLLAALCSSGVIASKFLLGTLVFLLMINTIDAQTSQKPGAKVHSQEQSPPKYDPIESYQKVQISGWPVIVHKDLFEKDPELWNRVRMEIVYQLYQLQRRVPAPATKKLKGVPIWVEIEEGHHHGLVYHPNRNWLLSHGMHPEKARCVEISNAANFLKLSIAQPYCILHEMAHAWHDQYLPGGHGNKEIAITLERAKQKNLYGPVLHINKESRQAYARKNPMEYFAESSEAFFGTNDFYPFVRAELKQYDTEMYHLLARVWGVNQNSK